MNFIMPGELSPDQVIGANRHVKKNLSQPENLLRLTGLLMLVVLPGNLDRGVLRMAKKSAPAPPAAEEPTISLSEAIRDALSDIGADASVGDVEPWIRAKYPKLQFKRETLSSTLSAQRKKLRGDAGSRSTKSGRGSA